MSSYVPYLEVQRSRSRHFFLVSWSFLPVGYFEVRCFSAVETLRQYLQTPPRTVTKKNANTTRTLYQCTLPLRFLLGLGCEYFSDYLLPHGTTYVYCACDYTSVHTAVLYLHSKMYPYAIVQVPMFSFSQGKPVLRTGSYVHSGLHMTWQVNSQNRVRAHTNEQNEENEIPLTLNWCQNGIWFLWEIAHCRCSVSICQIVYASFGPHSASTRRPRAISITAPHIRHPSSRCSGMI